MSIQATRIRESLLLLPVASQFAEAKRLLRSIPKKRNLCPSLRGWNIMQASRTCSKCLIWFAALLSPIQALQGTPILCHLVSSCAGAHDASTAQRTCRQHPPNKLTSSRAACGKSNDCGFAVIYTPPSSPRRCPPNCWCLRPVAPQSEPMLPLRVKVTGELSVGLRR